MHDLLPQLREAFDLPALLANNEFAQGGLVLGATGAPARGGPRRRPRPHHEQGARDSLSKVRLVKYSRFKALSGDCIERGEGPVSDEEVVHVGPYWLLLDAVAITGWERGLAGVPIRWPYQFMFPS